MKKIGQVFLYDISHIKKNVIAMIVVLGLCVVRLFMHGSILLQAGIHIPIQMV